MTLKLGLLLNKQYPPGDDPRARFLDHLEQVRLARDLGFDTICLGQHFLSSPFQELQSIPLLARFAADSGEMELALTIILAPLFSPVEIAEFGATLDLITGGRFICGLGLGYRKEEYDAFGVPDHERVQRFEQNARIVKSLWAGERVTCQGPHCNLENAVLTLRPIRQPPVWIAANADAAVRRAARIGDAWIINPHANFDTVKRQLQLYQEAGGKTGIPLMRELYIGSLGEVRPFLDSKYGAYRAWGQETVLPEEDRWSVEFQELARDRFVIGDAGAVPEDLQRYLDGLPGVDQLIFRIQYPGMPQEMVLRTMHLLAEQVRPRLKLRESNARPASPR